MSARRGDRMSVKSSETGRVQVLPATSSRGSLMSQAMSADMFK